MAEKSEIGVAPATLEEFQNFLEGSQTMDGGRHDLDSRGMTSDDPTMRHEIRQNPYEEAPYAQSPQPQGQNWQALYGREANEKGQWRRTAEEALAQLEALKGQFGPPQAQSYGAPPTNGYSAVSPVISHNQPPIPERFFPDRELDDAILVEDVEVMLKKMVAPEIWNLRAQTEALQAAQLQAVKGTSGIDPQTEAGLTQAHPWLNTITDPYARISAMRELIVAHSMVDQSRGVQKPQGQPSRGNMAVRRSTTIENTNPRVNDGAYDEDTLMRQDMAEALQKPFGSERTAAMREVFNKYGVYNQNDWGPNVLPR